MVRAASSGVEARRLVASRVRLREARMAMAPGYFQVRGRERSIDERKFAAAKMLCP